MAIRHSIPAFVLACAVTACAHATVGEAPPVAVSTEPAPATKAGPAPAAASVAPVAPTEHKVRVCAVAPADPTGLRMLDAIRFEGRPDTLAVIDGKRVPVSEALGSVRVAGHVAWFAGRRTLDLPLGGTVRKYAIYDLGRVIEPGDLSYLGSTEGVGLFAAREDVAPIAAELATLHASEHDLVKLVTMSSRLRARLRAIEVLYIPLQPTGCLFQPLVWTGAL